MNGTPNSYAFTPKGATGPFCSIGDVPFEWAIGPGSGRSCSCPRCGTIMRKQSHQRLWEWLRYESDGSGDGTLCVQESADSELYCSAECAEDAAEDTFRWERSMRKERR